MTNWEFALTTQRFVSFVYQEIYVPASKTPKKSFCPATMLLRKSVCPPPPPLNFAPAPHNNKFCMVSNYGFQPSIILLQYP